MFSIPGPGWPGWVAWVAWWDGPGWLGRVARVEIFFKIAETSPNYFLSLVLVLEKVWRCYWIDLGVIAKNKKYGFFFGSEIILFPNFIIFLSFFIHFACHLRPNLSKCYGGRHMVKQIVVALRESA